MQKIQSGKSVDHYETVRKRKDGKIINVSLTISPIKDSLGNIIGASKISRDITDRIKAEEVISESEETYRMLFESINDAVIVTQLNDDKSYKYLKVNDIACNWYGYTKEEFLTKVPNDIISENSKKNIQDRVQTLLHNKYAIYETEHITKDGKTFPVEISTKITQFRNKTIFHSVIRDITERKKAAEEIRQLNIGLEEKVINRTKEIQIANEELESFSYSVSHDLRAPLRAVCGYAKILEEDYNNVFDIEGKRILQEVQNNARRMGILIDDLLAFSRLGRKEVEKSTIDMNKLVELAIWEINQTTIHNAEIKFRNLLPIIADQSLMKHVMINLISNAIKYSSKKEIPCIEIKSQQSNGELIYSISDNGAGFDMQYAHKLFGVFQRLHSTEEFQGTGVGLAIVEKIINKHYGKVWAEGEIDKGATFYFTLPASN